MIKLQKEVDPVVIRPASSNSPPIRTLHQEGIYLVEYWHPFLIERLQSIADSVDNELNGNHIAQVRCDDMSKVTDFIYTSGTTGPLKAVRLKHKTSNGPHAFIRATILITPSTISIYFAVRDVFGVQFSIDPSNCEAPVRAASRQVSWCKRN